MDRSGAGDPSLIAIAAGFSRLPVLWTAARERGIGLTEVVKWLSTHPARLIGMPDKKGRLAKGFDADLVIIDPEKHFTVTEAITRHRHPFTPYLHEELTGVVERTYLNGNPVFDHAGEDLSAKRGSLI